MIFRMMKNRSTRDHHPSTRYSAHEYVLLTNGGEPECYTEAMVDEHKKEWFEILEDEMNSLHDNNTFELVKLPKGKRDLKNKWVYKLKTKEHTSRPSLDLEVEQMDVKTAFLHGDLDKEIYMEQPEDFWVKGKEGYVCRLQKSLYGLKQAPTQWYKKFESVIGQKTSLDHYVFFQKFGDDDFIILLLYVDDMLIVGKNIGKLPNKADLSKVFFCKRLSPANRSLHSDLCDRGARTKAEKDCPSSKIIMKDDRVLYASAVGSLMYAMVCTRPDLAHAVGVVSRFLSNLELGFKQQRYAVLYDNQSAIHLAKNSMFHKRTKHIDIRYHWIRDAIEDGIFELNKVHTDDNAFDMLQKAVQGKKFKGVLLDRRDSKLILIGRKGGDLLVLFTSLRVGPIKEGFIVGFDLLKTFIDMGSRIKANEGSSLEVYDAKVSARSRLYLLKTIGSKLAFKPERYKKFRSTVFGLWDCSLDHLKGVNSCFRERVLLENSSVKGLDLNKILNNHTEFNKLLDDDDVHIWLLETNPNSKTWWVEENNVIPRVVAWSDGTSFLKNDYDRLFKVRNRPRTLTPSLDEMKQKWWRMILEYFHNVSKAKVHREVDVRTNVHHDVDEGLSVPDVHHDVEEGLSVPELLKKISDMQRNFQSTVVEQFDFSSLTKNPHNRVALMKKITDMEVEFQRRITSIEDFLKIPRSPNLEKNSNVAAECMSVDKNTSNVDAECMSIDKNPSCGSDVKVGNKESMWVDSFVKVVEQNEFDQNVADKNLIHDFDQTVEWKMNDEVLEEPQLSGPNFIVEDHQQVSSKNCEVPLAGAEKIAVDALMKIINFDIPKESPIQPMVIETPVEGCKSGETSKSLISETQSHTCDSVEEANDAKVQREAKASKYRVSPYMIQPESTQQNHKVRARNKKVKKRGLPLTTHDGKVIPDWKEAKKGVGGCLIRPAEADWAICGPFFNTFMLGDKMSCCYVDGVTYGVPWFSESVEKVYFPINAEDNHWILAEFHIRSGVITFYDSLPLENLIVEDRKWWLWARQVYADKLPKLLIQSEVMEKKNIDPSNYSINYRLLNNLPLEVSNPTQAGLAYREHLTDFFWKYKIAK
ncbi:ulp1 protease family, C-terminal catalytic domain-containing protein [Tanacetum coccineum]